LTLIEALDECPSVVQDLMDGQFDGSELTTETLLGYLDKLRSLIVAKTHLTDIASDLRI
jgi:hypothetical protein